MYRTSSEESMASEVAQLTMMVPPLERERRVLVAS
jgi:hypothetical protein